MRSRLDLWWRLLHHNSCPDTRHESTWAPVALQGSSRTGQGQQGLRDVISCEAERRLGLEAAFEQSKENNSCCLHRLCIGDSLELSGADTNWEREWACLLQHFPLLGQRSWCWKMGKHTLKGSRVSLGQTLRASTPAICNQSHSLQCRDATKQGQMPALPLAPALRNGMISHAFGLEELILLKWLYYQKQSTALIQSLSKYTWHFP